jgi:2-polyprenyl-3-methyl-5-hydroxy-6-metoxy-1,4-benzoquinol methylase
MPLNKETAINNACTNNMEKAIINRRFQFRNKSHVKLNQKQILTRNRIRGKIENGTYRLVESPCLCGQGGGVVIAETDRYGLHLNTAICRECGLLRTNPRLDKYSLEEFYKCEYRDLYMESERVGKGYFEWMVVRGRMIKGLIKGYCAEIDFSGMDVFEIGCSAGGLLVPFLEEGATVRGCDYDQRFIDYGNKLRPGLNLFHGGLDNLKSENKKYDLVIINHVLEHLPDPNHAIEIINNSLKPNGILYVSVPGLKNPEYYFSPIKSFMGSLHIAHLYHFSELSLVQLMKGFKVIYTDDTICAIFQLNGNESGLRASLSSEYLGNIEFINQYEKSYKWKMKRLGLILKNIPNLIKMVMPSPFIKVIKVVRKRMKLSKLL